MNTALLIVDMQTALVDDSPANKDSFLQNIKDLVTLARQQQWKTIYVRHDGGIGDDLAHGMPGWELCPEVAPYPQDTIIDKRYNSAFKDTGLHNILCALGISTLILAGMQTEYCIDATCKSAFDLGYSVIIPEGCTTTYDNGYMSGKKLVEYYEKKIWDGRFATVLPLRQV